VDQGVQMAFEGQGRKFI